MADARRSIGAGILVAALVGAGAGGGVAALLRSPTPDFSEEKERIADLETQLALSDRAVEQLEREFATERAMTALLRRRLETGETEDPSVNEARNRRESPPGPDSQNASSTAKDLLARLFGEVVIGDSLAAIGPPGTRFLGIARTFPEIAVEFLTDRLGSTRPDVRVAAIRLAGRFGGDALVEPLTRAAQSDRSDLVRIFAAEALATLPREGALESWLTLLEADGPSGVRLHAWTGLARAGHPAAVDRFVVLLDRSDAAIPADAIVDTALSMVDPRLLPAMRAAFPNSRLSETHKVAILRTLARAGGEWEEFVTSVAIDEETPPALAEVALALATPPPEPPPEENSSDPDATPAPAADSSPEGTGETDGVDRSL